MNELTLVCVLVMVFAVYSVPGWSLTQAALVAGMGVSFAFANSGIE